MSEINSIFDLSQKILAYIYFNEPVDTGKINELITRSKLSEDTIKLNLERLHEAGFLRGHLLKGLGNRYFVHALDVSLTYSGMRELANLFRPLKSEGAINLLTLNIGELNFDLNLAKLF